MALQVRRFETGKGASLDAINRFLLEQGIREADVLKTNINHLGPDKTEYFILLRDSSAPFIVATFPTDGQTGVGPGTTILAIFSERIQAVGSGDIEVFNITDNVVVPAVDYTIDNTQVASQTRAVLRIEDSGDYQEDGKVYRVTFKTTIRDLAGNTMEEPFDLIFTVSTSQAALDFDAGIVPAAGFANPALNRWEAIVTPIRLTLTPATQVQLTFQGDSGEVIAGFHPHVEKLGASFRIAIDHDFTNQVPEPTAILPTGLGVQWTAIKGL